MYMNCEKCRYFESKLIQCLLKNKMMGDRCCYRKCDKFEKKEENHES